MAISEKDFREMPPNHKYRLTILFIPADRKSTWSSSHYFLSYKTYFSSKAVFSSYFMGLLIQRAAM